MKISRNLLLTLTMSTALLGGCATWSTSSVEKPISDSSTANSTVSHQKTQSSEIFVTDSDVLDRRYSSLGDITVTVNKTTIFHPEPTPALVNERLKEKAAELGADAVILVRYGKGGVSFMSWGSLEGKGRAIKYVQ